MKGFPLCLPTLPSAQSPALPWLTKENKVAVEKWSKTITTSMRPACSFPGQLVAEASRNHLPSPKDQKPCLLSWNMRWIPIGELCSEEPQVAPEPLHEYHCVTLFIVCLTLCWAHYSKCVIQPGSKKGKL